MTFVFSRFARAAALCSVAILPSCGMLPSSGPTKGQIYAGSVLREGDAFIVSVTDRVNQTASSRKNNSFSQAFLDGGLLGADTIRAGDRLTLTIWENVENGLFGTALGPSVLPEMEVDSNGMIFVPYAGRIRAAGNSPEAIRRIITNKLQDQTPEPQVQVARVPGSGAAVTLISPGGAQAVVPIERNSRTLTQVLSSSSAISGSAAGTRITITRGSKTESIFFDDLLRDPSQDIALRQNDRIVVEPDQRSFTVLGAAGSQTELNFSRETVSALEALAQVGGLNPTRADPTGVFVLRNESEAMTEALTGVDVTGVQRVVYVLDMTAPNGLFMARDFAMRDRDTIYVTEAPIVQFSNIIASLTGSLGSVKSLASSASSLTK